MRRVIACLVALLFAAPALAHAYEPQPLDGEFGAFVRHVRRAAARGKHAALAASASASFTVGEELPRAESLADLHERGRRLALARALSAPHCYRTGTRLVQCETPDPGPELDHTHLPRTAERSIVIFERTKRGWQMNAFFSGSLGR
jgi:hypothetical protein